MTMPTEQRDADRQTPNERLLIEVAWRESRHLRSEESDIRRVRIPGYRLVRLVGRGSQGAVYEAVQIATDQRVAIKMVHHSLSPRHQARLAAEIAAQRRMSHPNLLPILDSGESEDGAWFAMPLVQGRTFDPARALDRMSRRDAAALFIKIAGAVQEAHLHGVLHRDLKPSNILLNEEDEPFVADFGLARLDSITSGDGLPSLTMSGEFVGSLAWASPEQLSGDGSRVDVRSDVYAIGVMLHQVMTRGGTPFGSSDDVRALMRRVLNEPPTSARRQAPDMPRDLETIILNCLHREPERRYQSAGELARDLSRWLAGEPIEARRQSAAVSLRQWVSRHRAVAALAGMLVVLAISAMLVISVALVRATRAEADATQERQRAEALNAFLLNEILAAPSPEEQGRDVRLVDALQRASSRLDERFGADPIAKSDVARTIGVSFMALGLYDEADALLTEALEAAQTSNAPTHDEAIASMNQLAKLRWLQREPEASKALFQQAFDAATTTLGDAHERTLEAMTGLAVMRRVTGDLDGARDMCEAALRIRMERDGPTHKETLALTNNLAVIEREAGRPERAIELLQSARDRALESLGPMHPSTALLEINLASAMLAHGDRSQACDVLRDALDRQTQTLGDAHPEVALTKLALAEALMTIDNDESLRILDDVAAHPERIGAAGMDRLIELRRSIQSDESAP